MSRWRLAALSAAALSIAMALAYLRDPRWLLTTTSGLRAWQTERDGARVRWMGGHASFFVPAAARTIEIPLRTTFAAHGEPPVTIAISIDDRPGDRIVLSDPSWHTSVLRLPPPGSRRVRRIDLRADRTREDNRAAAVGEVGIH